MEHNRNNARRSGFGSSRDFLSPRRSSNSNGERKSFSRTSRSGSDDKSRTSFARPQRSSSEGRSNYSKTSNYSKPNGYSSDRRNSDGRPPSGDRNSNRSGGYKSRPYGSSQSNQGSYNRSGNRFGNRSGGGRRFGGGRGKAPVRVDKLHHSNLVKKANPKKIEAYEPKHKFVDFSVDERIKKNIELKKYVIPTPIQDQSIPHILEGKDVIGIANTGTGKTAAFLIPMIEKVLKNKEEKVLILLPTRELANQALDEFRTFARGLYMNCVKVIGGESIRAQMYLLGKQYNFIIGTPGRVKDLVNRGNINLSKFNSIILDEVDRMVDMGFIDDMRFILSKLPADRQSLFFSATVSKSVETLMRTFLKDPTTISVVQGTTSDNVEQDVIHIDRGENKVDRLHDLFVKLDSKKVIIFVKTKFGVDRLDKELFTRGFKVRSIHGDKSQYKRQRAIDDFKAGRADILVATDVAARGLDIPNVTHVINYDMPATYDDYVHRIGRTGRANSVGIALTFVEGARR